MANIGPRPGLTRTSAAVPRIRPPEVAAAQRWVDPPQASAWPDPELPEPLAARLRMPGDFPSQRHQIMHHPRASQLRVALLWIQVTQKALWQFPALAVHLSGPLVLRKSAARGPSTTLSAESVSGFLSEGSVEAAARVGDPLVEAEAPVHG